MFIVRQAVLSGLPLYLDPGSGSFLIQLLLAAILGISVATRLYWGKIKGAFIKKNSPSSPDAEGEDSED